MIAAHTIEQARAVRIEGMCGALKLKRIGHELTGSCPRCGGTDRFAVSLTKQIFNCRGCGARGDVIALTMLLHGVDFAAAVEMLTGPQPDSDHVERETRWRARCERLDQEQHERNFKLAERIWNEAVHIEGTPGALYFYKRGIDITLLPDFGSLRWHKQCPWGDGKIGCIVARFTDAISGEPRGIWRRPITKGEKPRTLGPMAGCVIRLWSDEAVADGLVVGEGVETVLAAALRIKHRGTLLQPAWACGCRINVRDFPILPGIEHLTILADNDASGHGQEDARACAERWAAGGREVEVLTPNVIGEDFNDIVIRGAS